MRNNYLKLFLVLEIYFPKLLQNSRKLSITESGNSNIAAATYLNHSPQWIFFFQYSRNLEIFFWKNTSERLLRQLVPTCLNVMTLNSSSHRRSSRKIAILKNSAVFTEKPLCWSLFWIKLQAWRHAWKPVTLLKINFNTGAFLQTLWSF